MRGREGKRMGLKHTCVPASSAGHRAVHSDVGGNMQLDGFPACLFYFYTQQHKPSSGGRPRSWPSSIPPAPSRAALRFPPPRRASSRSHKVIYTRTPREGTAGSLSPVADSLVPVRARPSCWAKTAGLPLPRARQPPPGPSAAT